MQTITTRFNIGEALNHLNKNQKFAVGTKFPCLINGAAGSGKSLVLIAKALNIIDPAKFSSWTTGQHEMGLSNDKNEEKNILITSYNSGVLHFIQDAIEVCVGKKFVPRGKKIPYSNYLELTHNNYTIYLVRFNNLVGALSSMAGYIAPNSANSDVVASFDGAYAAASSGPPTSPLTSDEETYNEYITEYNLTFWGCFDRFSKSQMDRAGMVTKLAPGERKLRKETLSIATDTLKSLPVKTFLYPSGLKIEWLSQIGDKSAVLSFADLLTDSIKKTGFPLALKDLQGFPSTPGKNSTLFDYIFVDEFQDMTRADFCLFYHLLKKRATMNIGLFGDVSQSVQLGAELAKDVVSIPSGISGYGSKGIASLTESYRLPENYIRSLIPLYNNIKPSAGTISKADLNPVKHALPGARLMFVYAKAENGQSWENNIAKKLKKILRAYSVYNPNLWGLRNHKFPNTMIMEEDKVLRDALSYELNVAGHTSSEIQTSSILKQKGLEFDCVIWSARQAVNRGRHVLENVYTILTRTTCLGIIVWSDEAEDEGKLNSAKSPLQKCVPKYNEIIKLLNKKDRNIKEDNENILFFDKESEEKFDQLQIS